MSVRIICQYCSENEAVMYDECYMCMSCFSKEKFKLADIPTFHFRQVVREFNDGNCSFKTLCLQQWVKKSESEPNEGVWRDIEISTDEPSGFPE